MIDPILELEVNLSYVNKSGGRLGKWSHYKNLRSD